MVRAEPAACAGAPTEVRIRVLPFRIGPRRLELLLSSGGTGFALCEGSPEPQEELVDAARRIARDRLDLEGTPIQLRAVGDPASGIAVVFLLIVRPPPPGRRMLPSRIPSTAWRQATEPGPCEEGDESLIIEARERLAEQVEHGGADFLLVREEFTVTELRRVHEAVQNSELDPSNFRKRVSRLVSEGRVRELDRRRPTATRPARLYSLS